MPASDGSWRSCPLRGRYADFVSYEMALRPLGKNAPCSDLAVLSSQNTLASTEASQGP